MNIMSEMEDVNKRPSGTFRDFKNTVSEIKILLNGCEKQEIKIRRNIKRKSQ